MHILTDFHTLQTTPGLAVVAAVDSTIPAEVTTYLHQLAVPGTGMPMPTLYVAHDGGVPALDAMLTGRPRPQLMLFKQGKLLRKHFADEAGYRDIGGQIMLEAMEQDDI